MMCVRLILVLWMLVAGMSVAASAAPYRTVVILGSAQGRGHPVLPAHIATDTQARLMRDLIPMLGTHPASSLTLLALPTACGEVGRTVCRELNVTTDERLLETIEQLQAPQVLVTRPMAGVWAKEQVYYASLDVTLLQAQPPYTRLRSFVVLYRDFECDSACTAIAHRYAAEEFRDMVTYMLSLELSRRPRALPPSWQEKPKLKHVSRWANSCVQGVSRQRLIRDDRDRAWLGELSATSSEDVHLSLVSLSWTGCT